MNEAWASGWVQVFGPARPSTNPPIESVFSSERRRLHRRRERYWRCPSQPRPPPNHIQQLSRFHGACRAHGLGNQRLCTTEMRLSLVPPILEGSLNRHRANRYRRELSFSSRSARRTVQPTSIAMSLRYSRGGVIHGYQCRSRVRRQRLGPILGA